MTLLDILVSPALAEGAGQAQQGNALLNLLPLILLFVVFYFLLIRPQQKKAKEHKRMVSELKVGDEVITQGGILGKITSSDETFLKVEIAPSVIITSQRNTISGLMPKGTYKSSNQSNAEDNSDTAATKPRRQSKARKPKKEASENTET
jgi:preprotein translocase subunit YajC